MLAKDFAWKRHCDLPHKLVVKHQDLAVQRSAVADAIGTPQSLRCCDGYEALRSEDAESTLNEAPSIEWLHKQYQQPKWGGSDVGGCFDDFNEMTIQFGFIALRRRLSWGGLLCCSITYRKSDPMPRSCACISARQFSSTRISEPGSPS